MPGRPGTLNLEAWDAGFIMLVDDANYKFLVTSDGDPFAYFLNPAVYGSGAAFVTYDSVNDRWNADDQPELQHLDDRYGVGATFLANLYGRPPYGSNLPGVFIKLNNAGDSVLDNVVENLRLSKAYTEGTILPFLIVKVYEQRLASYDFYAYLGKPLTEYIDTEEDSEEEEEVSGLMFGLDKDELVELLVAEFIASLNSGELHDAYRNFTGLDIEAEYEDERLAGYGRTITVTNLAKFDGHEVRGERFGEITTGHLDRPNIVLPGLTRVVGHEYYGFKAMRGVYTVFAPEKLNDLAKVVEDTLAALSPGLISDDQVEAMRDSLKYRWNDFFRGQDMPVRIRVGGPDNDPIFRDVRAKVFLAALGSQLVAPVVTFEDPENPGDLATVVGHGINLADAFSYVDERFHTSKPLAQRFTTGPYGAQGWVDEDGNVHYLNDQYSV